MMRFSAPTPTPAVTGTRFLNASVTAWTVLSSASAQTLPWQWLALAAAVPVAVASGLAGTVWTVHHYFWIDLAIAPAIAALLAAVATGRPAPLVWLLATRPVRGLGTFSYSLYLIHLPIVVTVIGVITPRLVGPGLPAFGVTVALAVPVAVLAAWLFAKVFEIPFQRHRAASDGQRS